MGVFPRVHKLMDHIRDVYFRSVFEKMEDPQVGFYGLEDPEVLQFEIHNHKR